MQAYIAISISIIGLPLIFSFEEIRCSNQPELLKNGRKLHHNLKSIELDILFNSRDLLTQS